MEQQPNQSSELTRRDLLKGAAAASVSAAVSGCRIIGMPEPGSRAGVAEAGTMPSAVVLENEKRGTRGWLPTATRVDPATKYRCPWVEGYCSHTSLRAGETIRFFVSTNPASRFQLDVYRMGYYQGHGARHMTTLGPFDGVAQGDPTIGPDRVRECQWEAAAELTIPADWPSGVYVGKLTEYAERLQSYVIFIVRDDRKADFIYQCSDTTWQAYNRWPDQFSLYDDGKAQWYWGPGVDVSFDRPYGKYCQIMDQPLSIGSGDFFCWEFPVVFWLEQNGYDVTYTSNLDTHADGAGLMRAKGFLSVGHDEYYSIEMFENLKRAIGGGVSVAFLSGNTCCGRIDRRPDSRGVANRMFGRVDHFGPAENEERKKFVGMDRLPHTSPNEATLVGARSTGQITGGGDYVCSKPGHWLFAGTGMKEGDAIPGLVGWEWHGDPATEIPGLEIVSSGPVMNDKTGKLQGTYTSTVLSGAEGECGV